jgi:hypothetical protein
MCLNFLKGLKVEKVWLGESGDDENKPYQK